MTNHVTIESEMSLFVGAVSTIVAYRTYIDASDEELSVWGVLREDLLRDARRSESELVAALEKEYEKMLDCPYDN